MSKEFRAKMYKVCCELEYRVRSVYVVNFILGVLLLFQSFWSFIQAKQGGGLYDIVCCVVTILIGSALLLMPQILRHGMMYFFDEEDIIY